MAPLWIQAVPSASPECLPGAVGIKIITPALQMETKCSEHSGHEVSEQEGVWVQTQFMWLLGHMTPLSTQRRAKNHMPYFQWLLYELIVTKGGKQASLALHVLEWKIRYFVGGVFP